MTNPVLGAFVQLRGRTWLVEGVAPGHDGLTPLRLACVADDVQGETLDVLWDAEIAASVHRDDAWEALAAKGTDDPEAFGAYLRTVGWNTATAADRDLFQAPFRAGIRLDAYQLLPLRKALRLPRVNMLIADDVGLGKTVEAGLILRELLLRRRIDFVLVAAPPSMTLQWQDELEAKFGHLSRHSTFGTFYYWSLVVVVASATGLSLVRWVDNYHLFFLGTLSLIAATVGRTAMRRRWHNWVGHHVTGMGLSYVLMLTAFYVDNGKNLPLWRELPQSTFWVLPGAIGIPIIVYTLLRHPLMRRASPPLA